MKKPTGIKRNLGDLGGRGCHPSDPTGEIFGPKHWPLPLPHEKGTPVKTTVEFPPTKYMLIDITTVEGTCLVAVGSLKQVQLRGQLQKAAHRQVIAPPLECRGFSKLELLPLQYLYWNVCQQTPPTDYAELCKACLAAIEKIVPDPISVEALETQVAKLASPPEDEHNPKDEHNPEDAHNLKAKSIKKATPRTPGEAPAEDSITGKAWVIAAQVLATFPPITNTTDWKPIRDAIIAACVKQGIKTTTSAAQYCRFKASKLSKM